MDDVEAIRLLKKGDISGLEALVKRYQVKAVRTAYLIIGDQAQAQDVVQETYLRIFRRIRSFDSSRPFEPYLMRSVVNAARNTVRRAKKSTSLDNNPALVESLLQRAATVESEVERAELSQEILQSLSKLSPRQRTVIVQRYYLEMSEGEMSQALDIAPGTVKWLLNAARSHLRSLLSQERSEA